MYTQLDTLARTVNGLMEHNSENINTLVTQDIVVGWILIGLAAILMVILIIALVFIFKALFEDFFGRMKWKRSERKINKVIERLYNNVEFKEQIMNKKSLRKYEIRAGVIAFGVNTKLVDDVTDKVWGDYKNSY